MNHRSCALLVVASLGLCLAGCSLFPQHRKRDVVHNPFPQLKRIAVLPFYNQSSEPTVDTEAVAEAYYGALQAIPGFEVLPVGVAKAQWLQYARTCGEPRDGADFQRLAQFMGVEAVVVGSVTDFDAYYPPRLAMTTHWYAANPGFHPIPPGYGLPWGTKGEKQIPRRVVREAEFELARSQLATQTPVADPPFPADELAPLRPASAVADAELPAPVPAAPFGPSGPSDIVESDGVAMYGPETQGVEIIDGVPGFHAQVVGSGLPVDASGGLPPDWPDPTDLIPDGPAPVRPPLIANHEPVLSHTRLYRGDDAYFTTRLADYVETGDDARPQGWQGYLARTDDFVRFCCHLHIVELLELRGGREESDLILQWPLSRY